MWIQHGQVLLYVVSSFYLIMLCEKGICFKYQLEELCYSCPNIGN